MAMKLQHYWNLTIRLFSVISRTLIVCVGGLTPLQKCSQCILQPQPTGQQDGATIYTARHSIQVLGKFFPLCLVSLNVDILLLAHSPSLSSCDYFLWGYPKAQILRHRPHITDKWKILFINGIVTIPVVITRQALQNCRMKLHQYRFHEFLYKTGDHLDNIIIQTKWW